ncbi:nuclear transport factor 2 family protein [Mesorhizobium sp. M00.F.Ca.ET.186.01.1.1]|nr:nuclear transport factor 2 family protein [bacterium M00.F.Ca.ET.205.01.1.1]TGU55775.1 nuclear transport factor 2 family protein [bacterium M00.F.Ca.ET.152.01.1.1]TGV39951.1 nuclear transport factor 2 family protein [Mesorhizobium sp. M00.F.Ca.ET.186.01.1.1]TGZ44933.1 nuclear transport factor 2 family protein [bacterium M00.F.Ca.ET.162.01.1.1]TIW61002.1 MAG: nuclear transport factor 2 family protein [Mesorhizobium sp.]
MTQTAPLDIATAFTKAWTGHDLEKAASFVAEDVVFDGPMQQSTGKEPYLKGLTKLSQDVTGIRMIAAFGDERQALLMYDLMTKSSGALSCAKHLTVSGGKIHSDKLTFDSKLLGRDQPKAK